MIILLTTQIFCLGDAANGLNGNDKDFRIWLHRFLRCNDIGLDIYDNKIE